VLDGLAEAGRGNTFFFTLHDQPLVLRLYRRGGLIRHLLKSQYLYTGLSRTRAMAEFDLLLTLKEKGLPVPTVHACCVKRSGLFYTASLVTHRLQGETLAQRLQSDGKLASSPDESDALWRTIGNTIARFHQLGVFHADLNAHNLMIDEVQSVSGLDFDRGDVRALPGSPAQSGWCLQNLERLKRSLHKLHSATAGSQTTTDELDRGIAMLRQSWETSLRSS